MSEDKGTCFVIAPIGDEGSEIRRRSDQVLNHILTPAAADCGYKTVRADKISEPGLVTAQVIQHIVEDPMVIADLTDRNPNVFYELALRHAIKKPVVQIIRSGESIPFDVAASRTVHVNHKDLDSAAAAREEIIQKIKAAEQNPGEVDTPISVAIELQSLRQSDDPVAERDAEMIAMLHEIRSGVSSLLALRSEDRQHQKTPRLGIIRELIQETSELERMLRSFFESGEELVISPEAAVKAEKLVRISEYLGRIYGITPPEWFVSGRRSPKPVTARDRARRREPEANTSEPIDVDDMPF